MSVVLRRKYSTPPETVPRRKLNSTPALKLELVSQVMFSDPLALKTVETFPLAFSIV